MKNKKLKGIVLGSALIGAIGMTGCGHHHPAAGSCGAGKCGSKNAKKEKANGGCGAGSCGGKAEKEKASGGCGAGSCGSK
ncbi:MAG: hypothetical protein OIF32_03690 [Campylobacterales bacterium]|nr:hypothetical protein [Campylobacterales bacterium]